MKNNKVMLLLGALGAFSCQVDIHSGAAGGGKIEADTNVCTNVVAGTMVQSNGQNANCSQTKGETGVGASDVGDALGKIGEVTGLTGSKVEGANFFKEKITWPKTWLVGAEQQELIANGTSQTITLPLSGKKSLYSLTPTEKSQAGKKIQVLLVTYDTKGKAMSGTPPSVIDQIAALNNTDKFDAMVKMYRKLEGETQWMELGEIFLEHKKNKNVKITIDMTIMPDGVVHLSKPVTQTSFDGTKTTLESGMIDLAMLE
jgi:hypothetical protein